MLKSELVDELYNARLVQSERKEELFHATREYERLKANAYIDHLEDGAAHFQACSLATIDPAVQKARNSMDEATLAHHRAWIEASRFNCLLGWDVFKQDEWDNNQP